VRSIFWVPIGVVFLTGCVATTPPVMTEPVEPPTPSVLVFEVPLLSGPTKFHFATLALFRDWPNRTRVVLEAGERIEQVTFSLALPNCFSPTGPNPSTVWRALDLTPGAYQWELSWAQTRTRCVGNGTLLYQVSGVRNGDRGNIPFAWPADAP